MLSGDLHRLLLNLYRVSVTKPLFKSKLGSWLNSDDRVWQHSQSTASSASQECRRPTSRAGSQGRASGALAKGGGSRLSQSKHPRRREAADSHVPWARRSRRSNRVSNGVERSGVMQLSDAQTRQ